MIYVDVDVHFVKIFSHLTTHHDEVGVENRSSLAMQQQETSVLITLAFCNHINGPWEVLDSERTGEVRSPSGGGGPPDQNRGAIAEISQLHHQGHQTHETQHSVQPIPGPQANAHRGGNGNRQGESGRPWFNHRLPAGSNLE